MILLIKHLRFRQPQDSNATWLVNHITYTEYIFAYCFVFCIKRCPGFSQGHLINTQFQHLKYIKLGILAIEQQTSQQHKKVLAFRIIHQGGKRKAERRNQGWELLTVTCRGGSNAWGWLSRKCHQ